MIAIPSLRATMRAMKIGDVMSISFGTRTHATVRNAASLLSLEMDRNYSVHINRETREYVITRNS